MLNWKLLSLIFLSMLNTYEEQVHGNHMTIWDTILYLDKPYIQSRQYSTLIKNSLIIDTSNHWKNPFSILLTFSGFTTISSMWIFWVFISSTVDAIDLFISVIFLYSVNDELVFGVHIHNNVNMLSNISIPSKHISWLKNWISYQMNDEKNI